MKFKDYTPEKKTAYVKAATKLTKILSDLGYSPHLGFGSLIGAVRGDGLIDGDYDIDICFLSDQSKPKDVQEDCRKLFQVLANKGLLKRYWDHKGQQFDNPRQIKPPFGQAHIHIDGFVVDLFASWVDDEVFYNTCQWGRLALHTGFGVEMLNGQPFFIPNNYDDILTSLYGNWETPSNDHPSKRLTRKCYFNQ